jgi:hypothetical protein
MRQEIEQSLKDAIASALAQGLPISLIASIFKVEEDWIKTVQRKTKLTITSFLPLIYNNP